MCCEVGRGNIMLPPSLYYWWLQPSWESINQLGSFPRVGVKSNKLNENTTEMTLYIELVHHETIILANPSGDLIFRKSQYRGQVFKAVHTAQGSAAPPVSESESETAYPLPHWSSQITASTEISPGEILNVSSRICWINSGANMTQKPSIGTTIPIPTCAIFGKTVSSRQKKNENKTWEQIEHNRNNRQWLIGKGTYFHQTGRGNLKWETNARKSN